jgi:HPt (histidine-containing phosphotransfer) domain-containing protein
MPSTTPRSPSDLTTAIDIAEMRCRLANDSELISDVARSFLATLPELRADLVRAHDGNDAPALRRAAHKLKGALLEVSARRAAELAEQIEHAGVGRAQPLAALFERVADAARELEALVESP